MNKKENDKKLICSICGQVILKNANNSGKRYAVRKTDPIICDMCSHDLVDIDEENQEKLEAKNYRKILNTSEKTISSGVKSGKDTAKKTEEIALNNVISTVKSVIKGQNEQVEAVSTAVYKNFMMDDVEIKSNLIILGDSGSGKTEMIKTLAAEFKAPYVIEDATRYTEAGYVGASVDDMIMNLYRAAGDNITKAQRGILVIDEGDKKGSVGDFGRDVSGENVLFSLLKIIEGNKVPITDSYGDTMGYFDTSKLTIIFIGAFPRLVQIRDKRVKGKGVIGYNNNQNNSDVIKEYTADDFIAGGFPKEFVGRFDTIVELNKLSIENLKDIIQNSINSTFIHYANALEKKGIKFSYDEDVVNEIAIQAEKLNIGARGIKKVVQKTFKNIIFHILADQKQYKECHITKNTVNNPLEFLLV